MSSHDSPPPPQENPGRKPGGAVIGGLVFLVGVCLVLWNSGMRVPEVLPKNIGTQTAVDDLFWVIFGVTGFFFILTEGLLIYFCVKYRAKPGGRAVHTHGNHALELTWTFIPGLILFVLAVMQTGVWSDTKYKSSMPDEKESIVVQVYGKQFEWHFRYPGEDGEFGNADDIVSATDLHVPVDRDVIVWLQSMDVLHSFWLPNLRLKQDLVPGLIIPQWFHCLETGKYEVVCAELCGSGHTTMKGNLIVHTQEKFDAWLKQQKETGGDHIPEKSTIWKFWDGPKKPVQEAKQ
ncbi:MAG: cytochrome c oxidase subunit II [Planctomycetota bacterium]|jgi:cytochrome c oxidase subunit 2